jgi:hypothetical protein
VGEDRPYSEIEIRRLAKQQRSPEFRTWQEREADDLARLLDVVPGLAELDDPWTVDGLAAIENAGLERFPEPEPTCTDEEAAWFDLYARGIGHIYLRAMGEGKWVWVKLYESLPLKPALEFPGHTFWTDPGLSIRSVVFDRRHGGLAVELERLIDWTRQAPKYNQG